MTLPISREDKKGLGQLECPVRRWARSHPLSPAVAFQNRCWTYAELERWVRHYQRALSRLGVETGSRIGLLSSNRPDLVAIHHALARLGAAAVPINLRLTDFEIGAVVRRVEPAMILAEEVICSRIPGSVSLESLQTGEEDLTETEATLHLGSTRAILMTSGTEGEPKAAELTVGNFEASAEASGRNIGADPWQRWLAALPLYHVGGLAMAIRSAAYGSCLDLLERFDEVQSNRAVDERGVTHLSLVEVMLSRMLAARGERPFPPSLKACLLGGGPISPELRERARQRAMPVLLTYGLTEATSQVTTESPQDADGRTAGKALFGVEVRVVTERGPAAVGEAGEIHVRGPTVMRGYFGDNQATSRSLVEGWLRTRDIGSVDDRGRLTVHARRSDLIISGGENIYPAEVELVLASHSRVAEAIVVARSDAHWGQVPIAIIVWKGTPLDAQELEAWCRARLAKFKIPRRFVTVSALPRSVDGKIERRSARRLVE